MHACYSVHYVGASDQLSLLQFLRCGEHIYNDKSSGGTRRSDFV